MALESLGAAGAVTTAVRLNHSDAAFHVQGTFVATNGWCFG